MVQRFWLIRSRIYIETKIRVSWADRPGSPFFVAIIFYLAIICKLLYNKNTLKTICISTTIPKGVNDSNAAIRQPIFWLAAQKTMCQVRIRHGGTVGMLHACVHRMQRRENVPDFLPARPEESDLDLIFVHFARVNLQDKKQMPRKLEKSSFFLVVTGFIPLRNQLLSTVPKLLHCRSTDHMIHF